MALQVDADRAVNQQPQRPGPQSTIFTIEFTEGPSACRLLQAEHTLPSLRMSVVMFPRLDGEGHPAVLEAYKALHEAQDAPDSLCLKRDDGEINQAGCGGSTLPAIECRQIAPSQVPPLCSLPSPCCCARIFVKPSPAASRCHLPSRSIPRNTTSHPIIPYPP